MYGVIYKITNTDNDKIYIGQTTRTVEERFQEHMDSPYLIGCAIRKHGVKNFTIEVIATCESKEELDAQEMHFIAEYDCITPKGYNCKTGGENGSRCDESKEKTSVAQRKRYEDPAERKKVSDGLKKFFAEHPEAAAAISARTKGRQDSDEIRERKSRGQKARQARLPFGKITVACRESKSFGGKMEAVAH